MTMPRIWANFNRADQQGRVILSAHVEDLKDTPTELRAGMHVVIWNEDLEAEGVLEFENGKWLARIVEESPFNKDKSGVSRD